MYKQLSQFIAFQSFLLIGYSYYQVVISISRPVHVVCVPALAVLILYRFYSFISLLHSHIYKLDLMKGRCWKRLKENSNK